MESYFTPLGPSMISGETMYASKSVCVIGAGPSGLASARELRQEGHTVTVMEQSSDIGGQWLYNPCVEGEDPLGMDAVQNVHSSVYDSLRLTSPREAMGFTDFPFITKIGRDTRRFPGHKELFLYLSDFCDHFGLRELVRFNTRVDYVGMVNYNEECKDLKWVVKSFNKSSETVTEEIFDAVVVATGHYSKPRLPYIKGMDKWKKRHVHSHLYRKPDPYYDQVVVVIGNCLSAHDISMELTRVAKEVHLSVKLLPISEGLTKVVSKNTNFYIHLEVDCLHEDGKITFMDGSWVIANSIIYCTGYSYSFPFLDTEGIVKVDEGRVGPLYEHTFPPLLAPSLSFVGIPRKILFSFFEVQGRWIAQVLSNKRLLPSWDYMMASIKQFYNELELTDIPKYKTHDIANFDYCDKYGEFCGYPRVEQWKKNIIWGYLKNADVNLETYREIWDDDKLFQEALQSPNFTQRTSKKLAI